ncbi:hypothetical protein BHM03_00034668 [Ensete ventricosum]|nr:hypothetical protein BHM03_00034668 [Ensete ventricosum]
MRSRPRAWLAPAMAAPAGIGSAHGQAARGSPTTRATACKGDRSCRGSAHTRWHLPPARCCPRATTPTAGVAAHVDGVQRRCLRRAMAAAAQ